MIRIIRGVYGFLDKDGIVRPKTEVDAPFSLSPEQEERLVRLGVAGYVGRLEENLPMEPEAQEDSLDIEIEVEPEEDRPLTEYNAKELRELGAQYGLSFKVGTSKADMVKAIEAAEAALDVDDEDEDGELAPVFDASEAVQ